MSTSAIMHWSAGRVDARLEQYPNGLNPLGIERSRYRGGCGGSREDFLFERMWMLKPIPQTRVSPTCAKGLT